MALVPIVVSALASFGSILATDEMLVSRDGSEVRRVTVATVFTSPALLGTPTAPTPTAGDSSTKIATTAFVAAALTDGLGSLTTDDIEDMSGLATSSPPTLTSALAYLIDSPTFTGNVTVQGNFTVNGTTTTVNSDNLQVEDSLIKLAKDNVVNTLDIGFYGQYQPAATPLFAGLDLDAGDGKFYLWKDLQVEPTTTVNRAGTGYTAASLVIGALEASQPCAIDANSSSPALRITQTGSGNVILIEDSTTPDSSPWLVNAGGVQVVGHTVGLSVGGAQTLYQQYGSSSSVGATYGRFSNDANGVPILALKSRSATRGGIAAAANGDVVFQLFGIGDDGTDYDTRGAEYRISIGAAVSSNVVPMQHIWRTMNAAGTLADRMTLSTEGVLTITATTVSTSTATGALIVSGGLGVAGTVFAQTFKTTAALAYAAVTVDANATFTWTELTSARITYLSAAITANRTVTLSTTNAWQGLTVRFTRAVASTGAFNWDIGGLKNLTAGTYCDVTYSGAAWVLTSYGAL